MQYTIKALIIVGFLLAYGCATEKRHDEITSPDVISEEAIELIHSSRVMVNLDQDATLTIPVMGQRTSHQYYGVIGKLAESAEFRFEKDLSDEQRQLLRGIDKVAFRIKTGEKFWELLKNQLRAIDWLNISSSGYQHGFSANDLRQTIQTQDEDALLYIDNRYMMAIDFSRITVFCDVTIYPHSDALVAMAKQVMPYEDPPILYQKLFTFEYPYQRRFNTARGALQGWNDNEGEMVKQAITESIKNLTNQIVNALSSSIE